MAKAELGDKLFHDVRLSRNNATCHDLATGCTDRPVLRTRGPARRLLRGPRSGNHRR
ncbi:MAG: cytochrome c peroxidase [Candidatus Hydrogenedentota bacterium]